MYLLTHPNNFNKCSIVIHRVINDVNWLYRCYFMELADNWRPIYHERINFSMRRKITQMALIWALCRFEQIWNPQFFQLIFSSFICLCLTNGLAVSVRVFLQIKLYDNEIKVAAKILWFEFFVALCRCLSSACIKYGKFIIRT